MTSWKQEANWQLSGLYAIILQNNI